MEEQYRDKKIQNNFDEDNSMRCNPKFKGLIEGMLSGSSHDRVVNSFVEMFDYKDETRLNAFDRIKSTGRLALPTLYGVLLDDEVLTYISAKSMNFKRKEIEEKLKDKEIKEKIENRKIVIKMNSLVLISKIVANLDYEEKNKAISVFQHVLLTEKNSDVLYSALLSLEKLGDASATLLYSINQLAKDQNQSLRVRNQAITLIAKASEFSKNSVNLLLNILSNPKEDATVKANAVISLEEYTDSVSKEQAAEIFKILSKELESSEDTEFINRCTNLFASLGSKILEHLIPLIKDRTKKLKSREVACFACFGAVKKDYNLESYVLAEFDNAIRELKPDPYPFNVTNDDIRIYEILVDLAKKLSY